MLICGSDAGEARFWPVWQSGPSASLRSTAEGSVAILPQLRVRPKPSAPRSHTMSVSNNFVPAYRQNTMLKCDYCGRENADETQACSGCGTSLVQGARAAAGGPQKRWKPSAGSALDLAVGVAGLL